MRALFVDANDSLAEVTERLGRPGDPAVVINRDPDITSADLPKLLAGYEIAIDDHTQFPTEIVKQCKDLKHIVFLGTGARSYMNPEELEALGVTVHIIKGYGDTAVAEMAFALMWDAARRIAADGCGDPARRMAAHRRHAAHRQDHRPGRARAASAPRWRGSAPASA